MRFKSIFVATLAAFPWISFASNTALASSDWSFPLEIGATYADREDYYNPKWAWSGAAAVLRRVGEDDWVGPTGMTWANDEENVLGAGIRWEHDIGSGFRFLMAPGVMYEGALDGHYNEDVDYFGEMGITYKRLVTVAMRVEVVRSRHHSMVDWDDPFEGELVTDTKTYLDARFGRLPGLAAVGLAALAIGIARSSGL